jgi:hypothetical protein
MRARFDRGQPGRLDRVRRHRRPVVELTRTDGDPGHLQRPSRPRRLRGLHVFDISNRLYPQLVGRSTCPVAPTRPGHSGSRKTTGSSSTTARRAIRPCRGVEIVEVPLSNPAGAAFLRFESSGRPRHRRRPPELRHHRRPVARGRALRRRRLSDRPVRAPRGLPRRRDRPSSTAAPARSWSRWRTRRAAGASAVIVADNAPGEPVEMGGADPTITIPSVRVSQVDGATIKAGPGDRNARDERKRPRPCHATQGSSSAR